MFQTGVSGRGEGCPGATACPHLGCLWTARREELVASSVRICSKAFPQLNDGSRMIKVSNYVSNSFLLRLYLVGILYSVTPALTHTTRILS